MLALASLLLATLVSVAVVGWMPRPAPPPMRLDQTVQVLRGERAAAPLGLHLATQDAPPQGSASDWLTQLAALQLGLPAKEVRLVWSGQGKAPDVQVIEGGAVLDGTARVGVLKAQAALLTAMQWPPFELGVRQADGRWQVVGSDHSDLAAWRRQVILALLGGAVLLAPLAAWASIRLGRPLRRLADASARVDLQADTPLPDDGPREVQMLAAAIGTGRERLRAQAQDMTHMLAAVAHDLRTPLTGLRLRAEFAPTPQAARMVADIERMDTMIEQVLDYARGELQPLQMRPLDLAALLEECVQAALLRGVEISIQGPDSLPWHGDALLLRRAFDNLIDNADRYAGAVELRLAVVERGVQLEVMDRGPGIAEGDRVRLLQPFQRSERSRSRTTGGAGLGLAVAANVARRHAGELQLLHREGGGLIACLLLGKFT
ncbi:TPA: HAMP domain-containing histidine kinase [Stenotrophomonas maltophilia]|uniref:sensor histidine kinase n=1 Tax=Stenotrophomonas maltophilia TaxID=40324 RepID=UPI00066A74E5|nr:HAMP domain-containing sensor histidine kinase [Stenotrophomonas maltophilia]EKT4447465.1 HAMP domain-containing histidine kinase [Stenotrophomonas maltophilia]MBC9114430.1 HAMP domain-containing histidine kinase [Stenotrophomonas maltophilia]MBH1464055.1 HAMP domain-containing histidine kinase [Stenotrophomonas maltophilia]MBH1615752.1 HAMP domain-containing histidine kinase [Stenotrophomonas maltophilia]MBN5166745.1 HAMP domain-containing histidine kinase [Stenotrophomonas maltophilia]